MPNIKSAAKRAKVAEKRRIRNKIVKARIKKAIKSFENNITQGNNEEVKKDLIHAIKLVDQAASKGVIHKNKADRKKSQLQRRFNVLNQGS